MFSKITFSKSLLEEQSLGLPTLVVQPVFSTILSATLFSSKASSRSPKSTKSASVAPSLTARGADVAALAATGRTVGVANVGDSVEGGAVVVTTTLAIVVGAATLHTAAKSRQQSPKVSHSGLHWHWPSGAVCPQRVWQLSRCDRLPARSTRFSHSCWSQRRSSLTGPLHGCLLRQSRFLDCTHKEWRRKKCQQAGKWDTPLPNMKKKKNFSSQKWHFNRIFLTDPL